MSAPAQLPGLPDGIDHGAVVAQMIRRATSAGFNAWWQRVEAIGFCSNPIHLAGLDDSGQEHQVYTRCNNRRAVVCPSCSDLYSRDTWQLIHAGLRGGHHDVPATVAYHPQVFVTLTAPSFGAVHTVCTGGGCHPRKAAQGDCQHGKTVWCNRSHHDTDVELGQPLCGACYDYLGHVLFTWHAPELWRRFTIRLRRDLKRELRRRAEQPEHTRISFMKVVELQRRAVPHFHAVVRLDAASEPGQPPTVPDTSISAQDLVVLVRQAATATALALPGVKTVRFGEQLDIEVIVSGTRKQNHDSQISGRQIAGYLAKYVTKSVADFGIAMRLEPRNINRMFHSLCARTEVPQLRVHDLRHSCATLLFTMGVAPATVQRILRHSSITVTTGTYVEVIEAVQRDALDSMGALFEQIGDESSGRLSSKK